MSKSNGLYQLTTQASKGNAFCWLTWPTQINWRGSSTAEVDAQNKRRASIEQQRAAGIDPLHIPGFRSANMVDPQRFALTGATNEKTPWRKGMPR